MNRLYDIRFSLFLIINIFGLMLCGFLFKKCIKKFPNKWIPIVNVVVSLFTNFAYLNYHFKGTAPWYFYLVMGILSGLASVGAHQIYKQIRQYFILKKVTKNLRKDKRKIIS